MIQAVAGAPDIAEPLEPVEGVLEQTGRTGQFALSNAFVPWQKSAALPVDHHPAARQDSARRRPGIPPGRDPPVMAYQDAMLSTKARSGVSSRRRWREPARRSRDLRRAALHPPIAAQTRRQPERAFGVAAERPFERATQVGLSAVSRASRPSNGGPDRRGRSRARAEAWRRDAPAAPDLGRVVRQLFRREFADGFQHPVPRVHLRGDRPGGQGSWRRAMPCP